MRIKSKIIVSHILAFSTLASCVSGVFAAQALSIGEWRALMTEPFSNGDWESVYDIASTDVRDIVEETVDVTVNVDENNISDLYYEILGVQTETSDKYKYFFKNDELKQEYLDFVSDGEGFKIPVLRWGGSSSLAVNLLNNIGPWEERKGTSPVKTHNGATQEGSAAMRMGPIEYLQMMYANNPKMKLIVCPSPFMHSAEDIENLAHFLLDEKGESEWGALRAEYGIENPVDVFYWELGNEVDWSIGGVKGDLSRAEWYIEVAQSFTDSIRKVDPEAKICACGPTAPWRKGWKMWHQATMPALAKSVDAISIHPYYDGFSVESMFKYMDVIKRDIDGYVKEQDIRDKDGNLKDIKILSTEGARHYGYNESSSYPGSMDFQSAVYTAHWLNNSFQKDYFVGHMYHNIVSEIFCWSFWRIEEDNFYHSTIEKMYKLYGDYLGDRVLGTEWSFYGTGQPTEPDENADMNADKTYLSKELYKWSTAYDVPDEPFISHSFSVLASGKGTDEITLFLCNRQMYRDLNIKFNFNNDYTLVEEAVFTAPNMTTFSFSEESEALTQTIVTPKNEPSFKEYHMGGLSVAVLKLKTKSRLPLTEEEALNGTGEELTFEVSDSDLFSDTANHWARNEIAYMKNQGTVSGKSKTDFAPDAPVTRAEAAAIISRMLGLDTEYVGSAFADVAQGEWYTQYANNMYINGFMRGRMFYPNQNITMIDMIKTANRVYRKCMNTSAVHTAVDIPYSSDIPQEYEQEISEAVSNGILDRLYENGHLDYNKQLTRAEAVVMLYNIYRKM